MSSSSSITNQNDTSGAVTFQITVNQLTCSSCLLEKDIWVTVQVDDTSKITCSGKISEDGLTATWNHPFLFTSSPSTRIQIAICFLPRNLTLQWNKEYLGSQMDTTVASILASEHSWQGNLAGLDDDSFATLSLTCKATADMDPFDSHDCLSESEDILQEA